MSYRILPEAYTYNCPSYETPYFLTSTYRRHKLRDRWPSTAACSACWAIGQRNWIAYGEEKLYFVLGWLEQPRLNKNHFTIWVPIHLSFNSQQGPPLSGISGPYLNLHTLDYEYLLDFTLHTLVCIYFFLLSITAVIVAYVLFLYQLWWRGILSIIPIPQGHPKTHLCFPFSSFGFT